MDTITLRAYALIIEEGSFSAAARRLRISKSMCSKYISDLEESLGARLLTRSTRSVKATGIGVEYYTKVRRILDLLDEANESAKATSETTTGHLRIGLPASYSLRVLKPHILNFIEKYPGIHLETVFDDNKSDLIADGFDAVFRIGDLEDTNMIARRILSTKCMIVAAPDYLANYGTPNSPSDLVAHQALHYTNVNSTETWPCQINNEILWFKITPRFSSNNGEIILEAAIAGHGIAYLPEFLIADTLTSGQLVQVLTEFNRPDLPISIVYPSRKNISGALRALLDFNPDGL
ncbi:MAG: LysR family transcriptional regulator [Roseinatronobacter sp.]|nr:LysR family transcriptional regulator [Roseinatronobacter sp.]